MMGQGCSRVVQGVACGGRLMWAYGAWVCYQCGHEASAVVPVSAIRDTAILKGG